MADEDLISELTEEALAAEAETPATPQASLELAQALAAEVNTLDARIAKGEELLKQLNDRKNEILGRELVELMDNLKLENFMVDGVKFEVGPYYHANIGGDWEEERRNAAFECLEQHDAGDLIKNTITIQFPREHADVANTAFTELTQRYQMATVTRARMVMWNTLTSWLKSLFENQTSDTIIPPLDTIGATVGRVVRIKVPRKRP